MNGEFSGFCSSCLAHSNSWKDLTGLAISCSQGSGATYCPFSTLAKSSRAVTVKEVRQTVAEIQVITGIVAKSVSKCS